jgi:hydrogenase maturation protease
MILILAYGNSLRRDDGAGFVLADSLESLVAAAGAKVKRIDSHQLVPELSLDIAEDGISAVIFVDTRVVAGPSDDLHVHIEQASPAELASPSVGHYLDASVLLAYTKHLFKKNPPAWLITIPGVDFDHGEGLGELAQQAIDNGREELELFAKSVASELTSQASSE